MVNDDLGNPLQNALVRVLGFTYLEDSPRSRDGSFSGLSALPEEFRSARTDVDGHYEIRGLPRDCSLMTHIDYLPEFDPSTERIHTGKGPVVGFRFVGYSGDLNHTFIAPVTVQAQILDDARSPVA